MEKSNDTRYNMISAALVFLISFGAYLATVAPSVAFWDCGEYIGASHSLGIPHPPGNPLFVLMMRVSSIFFSFFSDIAYRMNFAVALASALTAMVIYLVIVEAAKLFIGNPDTMQKRIALYTGGVVGGLFAAFGYTFWFSAVEMSVYNICMLNIAICTLLMLKWARSKAADRDKLLVLVAFLGFLGIGLHMYSMVIFPPAFLFIVLWDEKKRTDWRLWATGILMASVLFSLAVFLWFAAITLCFTFMMSMISKNNRYQWRFCFLLALFAVIGYSIHIFIPIRSALDPMINENHPSTWQAFVGFLERRQYGSESMISRMFWRRGYWSNQFGIEEHMGFGGFHLTQFFRLNQQDAALPFFRAGLIPGLSKLIVYLIPTAFMLYGWYYTYKKNKSAAIFLISLALLTSIGIVFYMNFADGNLPEKFDYDQWNRAGRPGPMPVVHREVRVRDYFFTAGFMYFGMWIGMAAACVLNALFSSKDRAISKTAAPICAILLIVSPVIPAVTNYNMNNRTGDWSSYDYGYNLLNSCEPNGIVFTNGDNDTFPLWALQEAFGVRRDVRVVNLSLVNTDWYIKQLKKLDPKVPVSYSDAEIEKLYPQRNPFTESRPHTLRNAGITLTLPGQNEQRVLRVQDMMVLNIVDATKWSKPIYFAMSTPDENLMGLAPYLQYQGLVYRVMPEKVTAETQYNLERTLELIDSVYKFRGIGSAKNNDTSRRHLTNYLQLAIDLRRPMDKLKRDIAVMKTAYSNNAGGNSEEALELARLEKTYGESKEKIVRFLDKCAEIMPWDWRARGIRHEFFIEHAMIQEAVDAMERALADDPVNSNHYETMLEQAKRALEQQAVR